MADTQQSPKNQKASRRRNRQNRRPSTRVTGEPSPKLQKVKKAANTGKQKAYTKVPDRFKNASNLQVRIRTGVVYIAVSLICVLFNNTTTVLYLCAVSGICAGEFYWMMRQDAKLPNSGIGIIGAVCYPLSVWQMGLSGALLVTVGLMLAVLVWYVYWMRARIGDAAITLFGSIYTGLLLCGLILIRQSLPSPWGGILLLTLLMSVWMNDAAAYAVGHRWGHHKLAPRTSPHKSWEGFIAGLGASVLFWIIMAFIPGVHMDIPLAIVNGLLCGGSGVIGDLAESRMKRNVGVKDSGTIMPGHGGLMDRCDSLIVCSVVAVVLLLVGGCVPYAGQL